MKIIIIVLFLFNSFTFTSHAFEDKRADILKKRIQEMITLAEDGKILKENFWLRCYHPEMMEFLSYEKSLNDFISNQLIAYPETSIKILQTLKNSLNHKPHFNVDGTEAIFLEVNEKERMDFWKYQGIWYFYWDLAELLPSKEQIQSLRNTINEMIVSIDNGNFTEESFWAKYYYPPMLNTVDPII